MKRMFDMLAAALGLIILAPLLLLIAVAIRCDSSGPVFFRQTRVGRGGRDFILLKFRTMIVKEGAEQGDFDVGSSLRITKIGRCLRRAKLDELPQLWNVLIGAMSLVGPRPEVRKWVDEYHERWALVLSLRPGITDPASIAFRNEEQILAAQEDPEKFYRDILLPRKLDLYETYLRKHNFYGDLLILLKTFWAVVAR